MSTSTTTITTTCDCSGTGAKSYSISGTPGGPTHPPGTNLTISVKDLADALGTRSGTSYAIASLLLGGLYLNIAESLPEGHDLRGGLAAKGYHHLGEGLKASS